MMSLHLTAFVPGCMSSMTAEAYHVHCSQANMSHKRKSCVHWRDVMTHHCLHEYEDVASLGLSGHWLRMVVC